MLERVRLVQNLGAFDEAVYAQEVAQDRHREAASYTRSKANSFCEARGFARDIAASNFGVQVYRGYPEPAGVSDFDLYLRRRLVRYKPMDVFRNCFSQTGMVARSNATPVQI